MTRVALRCDGDDRSRRRTRGSLPAPGRRAGATRSGLRAGRSLSRAPPRSSWPPAASPPDRRRKGCGGLSVRRRRAGGRFVRLVARGDQRAAGELPVAAVIDGDDAPAGVIVLSYHLDAAERLADRRGLLGPDFAPLDPRFAAARRPRGSRRVLVTMGGGDAGRVALESALDGLAERDGDHERFMATRERPSGAPPGSAWGWERDGLADRVAWADLALSAAGSTPYELACAGVPALLLVVADNQLRVAEAFGRAGVAVWLDARARLDSQAIGRRLDRGAPARLDAGRGRTGARSTATAPFGPRTDCWPPSPAGTPNRRFATGRRPARTRRCCSLGATIPRSGRARARARSCPPRSTNRGFREPSRDAASTLLVVEAPGTARRHRALRRSTAVARRSASWLPRIAEGWESARG